MRLTSVATFSSYLPPLLPIIATLGYLCCSTLFVFPPEEVVVEANGHCAYDPSSMPDVYKPGDLHAMFEHIVTDHKQYDPKIHSRPHTMGAKGVEGRRLEDGQIDGPWVVTLDSFMTEEECDRLIQLGHEEGLQRARNHRGEVVPYKTHHHSQCSSVAWDNDPVSQRVLQMIENVTKVPSINYDHTYFLRYESGQRYGTHHDYIYHESVECGARMLTFYVYLSDAEGGGTNFPFLGDNGLTVEPKRAEQFCGQVWSMTIHH